MSDPVTDTAKEAVKLLPGLLIFLGNVTGSRSVSKAGDIIGDLSDSKLVEWLTEYFASMRTDVVHYSSGGLDVEGPVKIEYVDDP